MKKPLFEVADIDFGYPFDSKFFNARGEGLPLIRIRDLGTPDSCLFTTQTGYPDSVIIRRGDLLVGMDAEFRPQRWTGSTALLNQRVCKVRPKSGLIDDQRFLQYALIRPLLEVENGKTGTTVIHLNKSDLEDVFVEWPDPDFRLFISNSVGSIDDKIELNRRMCETLEGMARALFKSWFVDFDPVRAKAEGRPTNLPAHTDALFPDSFEDSELGKIPKGWRVGKLGDVAVHMRRNMPTDTISKCTPYIALEHMPRRSIRLANWGFADGLASNKSAFKQGEILFGKLRPYFHKVGIAPTDGVCSTDIVVARPTSPAWFGFVLGHMSSDAFVEYSSARSTGTKMPRTKWLDMSQYNVTLPSTQIAEHYSSKMTVIRDRLIHASFEAGTLSLLRDSLLTYLLKSNNPLELLS